MKFALLQSLLVVSATASPHLQGPLAEPAGIVFAQSPGYQNQMQNWDEQAKRLDAVEADLEDIVGDVIQMSPEEMEILDPVLLELFSKKEELSELVEIGRQGVTQGMTRSSSEIEGLQSAMSTEISALEEAVTYLRDALDEYLGEQELDI